MRIQMLQPVIIGGLLVLLFGGFGSGDDDGLPRDDDTLKEWHCLVEPDDEDIPGTDGEPCPSAQAQLDYEMSREAYAGQDKNERPDAQDPVSTHPALPRGVHATLFLLAAAAFWLGCSNVARELVFERPIYRRERRSGLNTRSYLASVFSFQMALAAVQTLIMTLMVWLMVDVQNDTIFPSWTVLLITAGCGVALGLAVSSIAPNEVTAISVIPILLLPQLMLAGYLKVFGQMNEALQHLTVFVPLRWSFHSLVQLEYGSWEKGLGKDEEDLAFTVGDVFEFPDFSPSVCAAMLLVMSGTFLVLALARLVRTSAHSGH